MTNYRADIDGLRAIAVLSVVTFHLHLDVSGGFVGVDIFFVISGFLISRIIFTEVDGGNFSIARFYERRARRILPALLSVLLACSVAAALLFYSGERVEFAKSLMASALFAANLYFYSTADYFAPAANTIPLLHLWSLGIEEQFYIGFPLLVMFIRTRSSRVFFYGLITIWVGSLILSQVAAERNPVAGFYLIQNRAFELLTGTIIALLNSKFLQVRGVRNLLGLIGAAMTLSAIFAFNKDMKFPGIVALVPCIGSALLIWSGTAGASIVSVFLSARPLIYVGKISYSLYLIHWPVIVFGMRFFPGMDRIPFDAGVLVVSFALAALSFHFVEPFRFAKGPRKHQTAFVLTSSVLAIGFVVAVSFWTVRADGFADNKNTTDELKQVLAYRSFDYTTLYLSRKCFLDPDQDFSQFDIACLPGGEGIPAILWGDSHAIHFYNGLRPIFARAGYSLGVMTASACAPIVGLAVPSRPKCEEFNERALPVLLSIKPRLVILSASWNLSDRALQLLDQTIKTLVESGTRIVILGQSPQFKVSVPVLIANRLRSGNNSPLVLEDGLDPRMRGSDEVLSKRYANQPGVRFISTMTTMCPDNRCPVRAPDGALLYWDVEHLTESGSKIYATKLVSLILE